MSAPLMVSVSGVRGIAGKSFTPAVVEKYTSSFAFLQSNKFGHGGTIVVGRDSRVSGPWVKLIVHGTLLAMGFNVLEIGIVPTPTVQYMVMKEKMKGGIVITSSHNPVEWNGLKFIDSSGLFLSPADCTKLFELSDGMLKFPTSLEICSVTEYSSAIDDHVNAILSLPEVKLDLVVGRKYKVCLDTVNGAGGPIMKLLLEKFGCEVIALNYEPHGNFSHPPEPIPEHLGQLGDAVRLHKADFGVATDPDVDRCVFIDEFGKPIGEEYTLALAVEFWLGVCNHRGTVCKNLSSSKANDDIAHKYGCKCEKAAVGEINVANLMLATDAVIGGEGNGGVMLPDIHIGRDAPVALSLVISLLAFHGGTLSELKSSLPQWEIVKMKVPTQGLDADTILERVRNQWMGKANINTVDGVHIETDEFWVHLRKSNTEPIVRVIAEAATQQKANQICLRFLSELSY
eukprot:TRINITY_DN2598_c0_g1_i12.p1 TRINITY_DN2598_c0_g1~~TRINITY_DN2598_c0_g1_i12.p1  ORF type:complete len:457 (+),score=98.06 TRINITY_DN2598_c0_g1_i12:107-1477(+)